VRLAGAANFRDHRLFGIALVILGLVHIPLPQPDFHNVRHHDGPGEICVYHDHLLRWHPTARYNDDVAILHWHWFLPLSEPADQSPDSDGQHNPISGPALHAHVGDGLEPGWSTEQILRDESRSPGPELTVLALSQALAHPLAVEILAVPLPLSSLDLPDTGQNPCARQARLAWFQRWTC
jgi:hypothetical protein